jgi:hypothetical protein
VKRTLEVLNELEAQGVFSRYAIGGAMAATFYTEPVLTFDLNVFVLLHPAAGGLISLAPIYDTLARRGYTKDKEHDVQGCRRVDRTGRAVTRPSDREIASQCVLIEGVPVQFLPAYNSLIEEALAQAREIDYDGVRTRVVRAEHLVAICLQTGRAKDRARVALLHEQSDLDRTFLADLLRRYSLEEKWKNWTE